MTAIERTRDGTSTTITPAGKVVLYHVETGKQVERWPVDARAMVACGEYTADPMNGIAPTATVAHTPPPPKDDPPSHALGVPLVVTRSHDAPPAQPVQFTAMGKKVRGGG